MGAHEARTYWEDWGLVLLWFGVLSGPAAWAFNQLVGYALVKPSCVGGSPVPLLTVSGLALLLVATGTWSSWSCLAKLGSRNLAGGTQEDRSYFMAIAGIGLNLLLGLLILTAAVPPLLLNTCE